MTVPPNVVLVGIPGDPLEIEGGKPQDTAIIIIMFDSCDPSVHCILTITNWSCSPDSASLTGHNS